MNDLLKNVKQAASKIDIADLKSKVSKAGEVISDKADDVKGMAVDAKEAIDQKVHELDRILEQAVTDYNDAFTLMNDKGQRLYIERARSMDSIDFIENLINSIANHPKSFDADFQEINSERQKFQEASDFAEREIQEARKAAAGSGAGLAAGASVAFMAPTAAMWIATTFGTASTGAAISTLSGAAATNAALAWLGGGALAAGGHGIAGGTALLALAGPVGWSIAGGTLLAAIVIFNKKKIELDKQKNEEIDSVKKNTDIVKRMDAQIEGVLNQTVNLRQHLNDSYKECLALYGGDYSSFGSEDKILLGTVVNNTKTLSKLLGKTIGEEDKEKA